MSDFFGLKLFLAFIVCSLFLSETHSQIVSGNAFLKGNFVEVGLGPCGAFASTVAAPAGYHPRGSGGSSSSNQLGFVADPAQDGWTMGNPPTLARSCATRGAARVSTRTGPFAS